MQYQVLHRWQEAQLLLSNAEISPLCPKGSKKYHDMNNSKNIQTLEMVKWSSPNKDP